jgi:hypothetical protein
MPDICAPLQQDLPENVKLQAALHCYVLQLIKTAHTRHFSYCGSVSGQSVVALTRHAESTDIIITRLITSF